MYVSVVIPTYNRFGLLREAVGSVARQSYRDMEIIVVDDGSTDGTAGAVRAMADEMPWDGAAPPIRLLEIPHCGYPGAVRNRGIEAATGELVAFLDADDLWEPDKLERQVRLFDGSGDVREPDTSPVPDSRRRDTRPHGGSGRDPGLPESPAVARPISHTRERWIRNGREVPQKGQRHERSGNLFAQSLVKCVIGPSTAIVTRDILDGSGGFREDIEIAEDYELWVRLTADWPVSYLDEKLTIKRAGHGDQLSEKYGRIEYFRLEALRALVEGGFFADRPEQGRAACAELARKCRIFAQGAGKRGRTREAERYESLAALYDPAL